MYYYELDNKSGKRIGIIAGAIYIIFWVMLFLFVNFSFEDKQLGQGILINFGDVENASGSSDPRDNATVPQRQQQQRQTTAQHAPEEIATQDIEEAPEVVPTAPQQPQNPAQQTQQGETTLADTVPVEQPRVADPRLSFPGRTSGSTSPSEGATEGAGNQGVQEGAPEGSHDGTGIGADGNSFDLAGRSVMGSLPKPIYGANVAGKVIVEITVDAGGVVVNAQYRARGSTTNDPRLVNAALAAARSSRFNKIDGEGLQIGTITYNFHLQ